MEILPNCAAAPSPAAQIAKTVKTLRILDPCFT